MLQTRLKDLQAQIIAKEKFAAEESASSQHEDVEERDKQRARAEVAAAEEISSLREQLEHQRQELADRDRELAQYQRALSAAKEFDSAAAANSSAQAELAAAQTALAQAESKLAVLEPETLRMQEEITSLKSARVVAGEAVDQAERKVLQQTAENARVVVESTRLREDCDRLRVQLREAQAAGESATAEATEASRLLAQLRSEPERLAEAERQVVTLERRLKDCMLENDALRSRTDAAVDAAAARGVEGVGGSALTVLRHEIRVLKAQLVEVKAERDAANEAEAIAKRQVELAEQDVAMLKHRLALAVASSDDAQGPDGGASVNATAGTAEQSQQRRARSVDSPSLDHDHSSTTDGQPRRRSPSHIRSPTHGSTMEMGTANGGATDVHVSWSESSLISEQPRSDRSGSSSGSGSGGSDAGFSRNGGGRRRSGRPKTERTAFHTPGPGRGVDTDEVSSVAPSVAMTAMWSRDIGSDIEARRLRQELSEANATNHQLRSALAQMNRALHL